MKRYICIISLCLLRNQGKALFYQYYMIYHITRFIAWTFGSKNLSEKTQTLIYSFSLIKDHNSLIDLSVKEHFL